MGKGDKKTKRGKISMGSWGVRRPHKNVVTTVKKKKPKSKAAVKAKPKAAPKATEKEVAKKEVKVVEKAEAKPDKEATKTKEEVKS